MGLLGRQALLALLEAMAHRGQSGRQALQEHQGLQARRGILAQQEWMAETGRQAQPELPESPARQGRQGLAVRPEIPEQMGQPDRADQQGQPGRRGKEVCRESPAQQGQPEPQGLAALVHNPLPALRILRTPLWTISQWRCTQALQIQHRISHLLLRPDCYCSLDSIRFLWRLARY